MSSKNVILYCSIVLGALLLFVPFLGGSHLFDWDEVNFAEAAREMLVTGEYSFVQINFKPFWEKPPLFIWMQAISMSLFGVNEFAARLPNAFCGALTLCLIFSIGNKLVSKHFGFLWMLVFVGSMLPQFYFRSGIIDPWFNFLIFAGIHQLVLATSTRDLNRRQLAVSALFIGLAVMTKGPTAVGLVGISAAIYFITSFKAHNWRVLDVAIYLSLVLAIGFSWFLLEIARGHGHVVQEFIDYHIRLFSESEAGHGQPFYYHPIVLLIGCFPMSLFFFFTFRKKSDAPSDVKHYVKWMTILFWVVLVVFSIVKTKIVHYSSLTYLPMSMIVAWYIYELLNRKREFPKFLLGVLIFFIVALGSAFTLLGSLNFIKPQLLSVLKNDLLAVGNFSQFVPDMWYERLIGPLFLVFGLASVFALMKSRIQLGIHMLFGTTLVTVALLSIAIVPKIDRYTQTSLFEFYKKHGTEYYMQPLVMRSYAHLFYAEKTPIPVDTDDELKWMLFEQVDRPVFFICREQDLQASLGYFPHLKEMERKGGYVILVRTDENYPFLGSL